MALRFASVLLCTLCAIGFGVAIPAPPPTGRCGLNAERRSCGTACAPTCKNPNPSSVCVLPCVDACFCKEGYLKASNGLCVRPEECETVPQLPIQMPHAVLMAEEPKDQQKCGADEEYRTCGPSCVATCTMPLPKPWCSLRCFPGCYCKEGYLKNKEGKCVHATRCQLPEGAGSINIPLHKVPLNPKGSGPINIPLQKAPLNHEGSGPINIPLQKVPLNHESSGPINIPLQKVPLNPKSSGPINIPLEKAPLRPKTSGPISIPLEKSPLQLHCTTENEEFHACGTQLDCLASCKPPTTPKCMERQCTPGCVCREPLVRHEDGRCVEKTQCPKVNPFTQA